MDNMTASPANDEQARLLSRLEGALNDTSAGFARGGVLVCGVFLVCAIAFAAKGAWFAVGFSAAFGVVILLIMRVAIRRNATEKMRPVFEAVRDAPERVTLLHHYQTSDSQRMFVTHWVLIKTAEGHLLVKAKDDWEELLEMLQRRCPNAQVAHA
jgi:hypothetical protein